MKKIQTMLFNSKQVEWKCNTGISRPIFSAMLLKIRTFYFDGFADITSTNIIKLCFKLITVLLQPQHIHDAYTQ
jgi:hypothetical protein